MRFSLHLKPFYIYNIILLLVFSLIVNANNQFIFFYSSLYVIFHFILIYLFVYHYRLILYFIFFFYGLCFDILLFNEIGPHLLVFMIFLTILSLIIKYLYNFNSIKIYFFLLFFQLSMILFELIASNILFDFKFDWFFVFQIILISFVLSYPIFLLFSKIDLIK